MKYCVYSGHAVSDDGMNDEHIFPLALGGHDQFTIKVSKSLNVLVNKELDERLKSCFFLSRNRKIHHAKGHRNKEPNPPKVKVNVGSDRSVVFKFDENNFLQPYSHRRNKMLSISEIRLEKFSFSIAYEPNVRLRFVAKIALASGYFAYGSDFVKYVNTEELRALMNYLGERHDEDSFKKITTTGWFWPEKIRDSDAKIHGLFQDLNDVINASFVALITSAVPTRMFVVVGILGELTGVISCPANCAALPKAGDYDLGHVIVLRKHGIQRLSYRSCLQQIISQP